MSMNTDHFKDLVDRYISGTLREGDKAALRKLLDDPRYVEALANIMDDQFAAKPAGEYDYPEVVNRIKTAIEEKINTGEAPAPLRKVRTLRPPWLRAAAAAAIIILTGGGAFWALQQGRLTDAPTAASAALVVPGNNKAVLTLADGSVVTLDSAGNRVIQQGSTTIRQQGGQLQYAVQDDTAPAGFNTLTTPKGGQYQVTLPDGTRVWLNASSALRFPTDFNEQERNVTLTGEAYFEVAANKNMPFKVAVNNMKVEVLGTHFNISAYADEHHSITTLLEGSVRVHNSGTGVLLKPGQQALHNNNTADIRVSPGDTEGAIAWKNGYFKFSNENIQSVMRKISRWYNVEVEYRGNVAHKALWGTISRFEHISEVIRMLELTGSIHLSMEGRKIIVMP